FLSIEASSRDVKVPVSCPTRFFGGGLGQLNGRRTSLPGREIRNGSLVATTLCPARGCGAIQLAWHTSDFSLWGTCARPLVSLVALLVTNVVYRLKHCDCVRTGLPPSRCTTNFQNLVRRARFSKPFWNTEFRRRLTPPRPASPPRQPAPPGS